MCGADTRVRDRIRRPLTGLGENQAIPNEDEPPGTEPHVRIDDVTEQWFNGTGPLPTFAPMVPNASAAPMLFSC